RSMNFIRWPDPRLTFRHNARIPGHWPGFDDLIAELKKTYKIRIEPLDAADFGTPQNRRRLFIVGDKLATPSLAKPILRTERDASSILDRAGTYAAEPVYNGRRAASTIE